MKYEKDFFLRDLSQHKRRAMIFFLLSADTFHVSIVQDDRVGEDNLLRGRRRLRSSYSRGSSNSNKSGGSGKSPFGKEMNPESDVEDLAEDFDVIDDDNFLIEFADSSQEP